LTFGERLQEAFEGKTIDEIATILGVTYPAAYNYLKRNRIPEKDIILKIAQETEYSMSWLLVEKGPKKIQSGSLERLLDSNSNLQSIINHIAKREGLSADQKIIELALSSLMTCSFQMTDVFDEDKRMQLLLDLLDISQTKKETTPNKRGQVRRVRR
jgi:transcriptional regulator with XRE-family HTH domain